MPLFEYKCPASHVTEELFRGKDVVTDTITCACGAEAVKQVAVPARTASLWGDSAGYFDRGLNCYVQNSNHRDAICEERGIVPLNDLPGGYVDDACHQTITTEAHYDKCADALLSTDLCDVNTHSVFDEAAP